MLINLRLFGHIASSSPNEDHQSQRQLSNHRLTENGYWTSHTCLRATEADLRYRQIRRGGGAIRPCPIRSVNRTWPPPVKDFYHTKMTHNLVSVYSVFFQPHSTSEPITIILTAFTSLPSIYMYNHLLCLWPIARHLTTYSISIKLSEWNKAAKCRTLEALRECKPPPSPHFLHVN